MRFSQLINMKMPTLVGIFIFFSRENFMLCVLSMKKSFITAGPGHVTGCYIGCAGKKLDWHYAVNSFD